MNACMLTIGDELLQGYTVDTNSAWLGKTLENYNIQFKEKITISDDLDAIVNSTKGAIEKKYPYIFITGGLGPTHDDVTKTAMKHVFESDEYFDEAYYELLKQKFAAAGISMPDNNRSQAVILTECTPLENKMGTALGMYFTKNDSQIFVMPGVPNEMKSITKHIIIPNYLTDNELPHKTITLLTTGVSESRIAEQIMELVEKYSESVKTAFLPQYTGVNIRLRLRDSFDGSEIKQYTSELKSLLGPVIYGTDDDTLESVVGTLLRENNLTISAAESCTGGLISKRLTNIAGSSDYFVGSVIVYNNILKEKILNVSSETLETQGAVSEKTATEMAMGIRKITGADLGVAATGISGPGGGSKEKPVGLVYIAVSDRSTVQVKKINFPRGRDIHRILSANTALNMVRMRLIG